MSDSKIEERVANSSTASSKPSIDTNPYFLASNKKVKKLPDWLDHFNSRDLKVWFKCSIAAWIYTLFILINPTLRVIGQATFFGLLVLFMVPPSGVIFIGLMAGFTIILGASLGWAWGTIAMKAALATRPAADLQKQYIHLQQLGTGNTTYVQQASGQTTWQQIAIYDGAMLDTRVSVTYFCLIGLFVYLVSRLRVVAPKLTLVSMFAMIISDIYLTVAPLLPTFQGTIPRTLILPAAIAVGVSLVCNILFFPRSTSHLVLDGMQDMLKPMNTFLEACLLGFQNPDVHMEIDRLKATKAKVLAAFKANEGNFGFLALDASVGRWGTDDVKSLHEPIRQVLVQFIALLQIQISRREHKLRDERLQQMVEYVDTEGKEADGKKKKVEAGTQHLAKLYDYRQRSKHPESEELLKSSIRALATAGEDLLQALQEALAAINSSFRLSNTKRWFGRLSVQQCEEICAKHTAILNNLKTHKIAFAGRAAKDLWENHQHMFDSDGKLSMEEHMTNPPPVGGIMLSLILEERLYHYAESLENLLSKLVELERERTKVRLWLPGNLQDLPKWALKKDLSANDMSGNGASLTSSSDDDEILALKKSMSRPEEIEKKAKKKGKKSKKAAPDPNTAAAAMLGMSVRGVQKRGAGGRLIIGIAHWFSSTEGMFALRILVVTIAMGVPAVIPSSAGFYYREKGLWALIMAQTGLVPYTADFIAGFIMRMIGTVCGAVIGLCFWYIGAGSGPGNPYGMAAIAAPIVLIFMWLRLFTSPALLQAIILTVITCYLVMAYSWVDTHIPSYGNPGVGVSVFWRRMLLVMVGFAAAAIVTFFPRPPSASKHHRRLLSECLQTIKNQYALFVINCKEPMPDLKEVAEKTAIDVGDILLEMEPQLKILNLELSTSNFDASSLGKICHICMTLNQTMTLLLLYATQLPEETKGRFLRITGAAHENVAADVMAVITIVQQSLKTGDPLPAVLPVPLLIRSMEGAKSRAMGEDHVVRLNEERLAEETTRRYCSAMAAFVQFLSSIDEMVVVTKRAVGETGWVDMPGTEMARVDNVV